MKKSYCIILYHCIICGKYTKFNNHKISLVLSIICSKCKNEYEKIFKGKKSIEID